MYEKTDDGKIDFQPQPLLDAAGGLEALQRRSAAGLYYQYDLACNGYVIQRHFLRQPVDQQPLCAYQHRPVAARALQH